MFVAADKVGRWVEGGSGPRPRSGRCTVDTNDDERKQLQKELYVSLKTTMGLASLSVMCCHESVKEQWCCGPQLPPFTRRAYRIAAAASTRHFLAAVMARVHHATDGIP